MKTVQARWYTQGRIASIAVIVIHDMEAPEGPATAENCARYFATTDARASAHVCVDNDSAVRCVADGDTAWAAPGANASGLQLEIAGYMRQTRAQWLDTYSRAALAQAARVAAAWALKYRIPVRRLTVAQLKAGERGFVGHVDVSSAFHRSDHTDPGPGFPWDHFLGLVRAELAPPTEDPVALTTDDVRKILMTDGVIVAPDGNKDNPTWTLASHITDIGKRLRVVEGEQAANREAVGHLADAFDAEVKDIKAALAKVLDLLQARGA